MARHFEIVVEKSGLTLTAELLEDQAPLTCDTFWDSIAQPWQGRLNHGHECGAELWTYVPPLEGEIPYENSTVFPAPGEILYYHFIQPATREGRMVYDIGLYYAYGASKIDQGWIAGNLFARVLGQNVIRQIEELAADLLANGPQEVLIRRA
jgi:hypothetical protein